MKLNAEAKEIVETGKSTLNNEEDVSKELGEELNLKRKLLQTSVVKKIRQLGVKGGSDAPWVVELDPTSACNLACPDCISISLLNKGGFTNDRLRKLAVEIVEAGVKAVIMIGGGEPLAHKDSGWVIDYFGTHGLHVGVTTNGTLIDSHIDCLAEHTRWVRVSVDAGTPETFQKFRPSPNGVSKFDQVIKNMALLGERKKGKMGFSFLLLSEFDPEGNVTQSNVSEIYTAGKIAKEIGCDYFEVKPSYDFDHYLIGQPSEQVEATLEEISRLDYLKDDQFRVITPATLKDVLSGKPLVQPKTYQSCQISELRTLVTPSGTYVCPYFRGVDDKRMGDLTTQSFADMWGSDKRKQVMKKLDPSKDCNFHCIRHKTNLALEEMFTMDEIKTIDDYDFFI